MEIRPTIALLVLLLSAGAFADAFYKWTDENGVVHFSDRPHPGAEEVDLGLSAPPRPPPTTDVPTKKTEDSDRDTGPFYKRLEINNPDSEETLWNIETVLNVDLELEPSLQPGHQLRVYYDGMPRLVSSTSFQLTEVYRGVHNIQAEVIDATGKLLIRSTPTRFYVQQNTVN